METDLSCPGNRSIPALSDEVILATQVTASITCILSICGASLIIFTYVAFKDLRTTARQLLVSLSVADVIIGFSHLIGLFANYERFITENENGTRGVLNTSYKDALCVTQGASSMFATVASLLLSMFIGFYMLVLTQSRSLRPARRLLPFIYVISWGVPVIIIVVVAAVQSFGYEPISNPGWCYTSGTPKRTFIDQLADVLSYEFWAFLCFLLLTILYVSLFVSIYLKCKACKKSPNPVGYGLAKGDVKLLAVPLIFFILRIWTSVIDSGLHYTSDTQQNKFRCSTAAGVIAVLAGIGLNAQGFANAILFCAFTKQVREQLKRSSKTTWQRLKNCCVGVKRRPDSVGGDYSFQDEKVKVLINSKRTYGSSVLEESELIDSLAE